MKRVLMFLILYIASLIADDNISVLITKDLPYFYTNHHGIKVKVMRIQDVDHRLNDDYTKTSRECPPFCIHPTKVDKDIETIAELEFIDLMRRDDVIIVDARLKSWYELETIPSAINIPYTILENKTKEVAKKLFLALGMSIDKDGKWNFKNAKTLAIFCNGVWCDQSPRLIKNMVRLGYPKDKLKYYRDGFQGWKLLGFTTVVEKENKK